MLKVFLILYVLNLILDYPLQGDFLANFKSKNNYILYVHSMIWGGGLSVALMYLGLFAWWKFAMLLIGHIIIDAWKCRGYYKKMGLSDWDSLYTDQLLHVIQLIWCL